MKTLFLLDSEYHGKSVFVDTLRSVMGQCDVIGIKMPLFYSSPLAKMLRFWTRYLLLAGRGLIRRNGYQLIISWHGGVGVFCAFFKRVLGLRDPKLMILTFIYRKRRNRAISWIRFLFTKFALASADYVISHSSKEVEYYQNLFGVPSHKFKFVPLGIQLPRSYRNREINYENQYIMTAGKSNRDYQTLFEAIRGIRCRFVILAQRGDLDPKSVPPEADLFFDLPFEEYLDFLGKSLFVVIPLKDGKVSSGQLVILEAMALGKAVVVSETWGTIDYIENMSTGILVKPGDAEDLQKAICYLLENEDSREEIGRCAQTVVCEKYSTTIFGKNIANLALQLTNRGSHQ